MMNFRPWKRIIHGLLQPYSRARLQLAASESIKYKVDGTLDKYKARLVANEYTQLKGLNYTDTFSHVAKMTLDFYYLWLVHNWRIKQLDVKNSLLHGDLKEEVYMKILLSLNHNKENQVFHLHKSLYGLKQASRQWNAKLSDFLLLHKYKQATGDHSLFLNFSGSKVTTLLVYIDDVALTINDISEINNIISLLDQTFKIENIGDLRYFTGFEVARTNKGLHLCQRKYTLDLLNETWMIGCAPIYTPINFSKHACCNSRDLLNNLSSYKRFIGKLIYLTNNGLDITQVVCHLS